MHHGRGRAIDRAIAFLHAVALMFGFDIGLLEWLFSKIVSLTTDMGIEMRIPDVPNTLVDLRVAPAVPSSFLERSQSSRSYWAP